LISTAVAGLLRLQHVIDGGFDDSIAASLHAASEYIGANFA
jgi:hypothetical protein